MSFTLCVFLVLSLYYFSFVFKIWFVCFLCLSVCFLKRERNKVWNCVGREALGGIGGGENIIRIDFMKNIFLIKHRKKLLNIIVCSMRHKRHDTRS